MKPDKIHLSLAFLIVLTTVSWVTSCTHDAKISDLPQICFDRDVLPVYLNNCAISGCHNGNGRESRMALNDYASISSTVVPFNPDASQSYKAIIATWSNRMPPGQPLTQENRTIIRLWIEQGALSTICDSAGTNPGGGGVVSSIDRACFTRDILPVLVSRCATSGCHDATSHKSGYTFTSYTTTMKSVSAGNPGNSRLYQAINLTSGENRMPPSGRSQLTVAEIDSIGSWISYGALNETCVEPCDTINPVTFSGTIWPILQSSCTGCHSGTSAGGGIVLASYADVHVIASNGSLINSLKGAGVIQMPKGGSFSTCRIRQFEIWINNGFLNN